MENRTSRVTFLIDPKTKGTFDALCAKDDVTTSQMMRKLIRDYIESKLGSQWRKEVFGGESEDDSESM